MNRQQCLFMFCEKLPLELISDWILINYSENPNVNITNKENQLQDTHSARNPGEQICKEEQAKESKLSMGYTAVYLGQSV